MREFEIKLILEVKNNSCIYAKNAPNYSNRISRENAWVDIGLILGRRVDECQKKWNSLRDCFSAIFREETNTPSGSASNLKPKWVHFEALEFLIPYIKVQEDDCGNYSQEASTEFFNELEESELECENDPIITLGKRNAKSTNPNQKKKKKGSDEDEFDRLLKAIERTEIPVSAPKKPMRLFFEGIATQVEHFTAKRQIELQQKILLLLTTDFGEDL